MKYRLFVLAVVFILSGCSSPSIKDMAREIDRVNLSDEERQYKMTYLFKDLMSSEDRKALVAMMYQRGYDKENYNTLATDTHLAWDAVTSKGSYGSFGNAIALDAAMGILSAIYDGSYDQISKFYLPDSLNGTPLESAEQAHTAARSFFMNRVQIALAELGYTASCIAMCDHPYRQLHQLNPINTYQPKKTYLYKPLEHYMLVDTYPMIPSKKDPILASILGFQPQWESKTSNGWTVTFHEKTHRDKAGNVRIGKNERGLVPRVSYECNSYEYFADFLRIITTDNPYFYWADDDAVKSITAYSGDVYTYAIISEKYLLREKVVELPRSAD